MTPELAPIYAEQAAPLGAFVEAGVPSGCAQDKLRSFDTVRGLTPAAARRLACSATLRSA